MHLLITFYRPPLISISAERFRLEMTGTAFEAHRHSWKLLCIITIVLLLVTCYLRPHSHGQLTMYFQLLLPYSNS
jgi:hypothetical protein